MGLERSLEACKNITLLEVCEHILTWFLLLGKVSDIPRVFTSEHQLLFMPSLHCHEDI